MRYFVFSHALLLSSCRFCSQIGVVYKSNKRIFSNHNIRVRPRNTCIFIGLYYCNEKSQYKQFSGLNRSHCVIDCWCAFSLLKHFAAVIIS